MAFCPNCGSQATGAFCPNCGTPLSGAAGPTSGTYASPSVGAGAQGIPDNVAGALCYTPFFIGIVCSIVLLLISPYSRIRFVRFHAMQSLFLHVALFILSVILSILFGVMAVATHGLGLPLFGFHSLLWVASLILFFWLMYQAYNRQMTKLPLVGDLALKQA